MGDNTGRDRTEGTVENGEQVAIGRGNRQDSSRTEAQQNATEQQSNPRQRVSQRAGDINFTNQDNWTLWLKLTEMTADIRALDVKVDGLDRKIDGLPDRVGRLERVEVTVRPSPEIVVHPVADSMNLSVRMIFTILGVALLIMLVIAGFLIYLQVSR